MNEIPSAAWAIGGFALAHAAWIVSDQQDLLAPFAIVERSGRRELQPFEADTQVEAIAAGKKSMAVWSATADAWAFAREGMFKESGAGSDVVVVDFWANGMQGPATIIQRFRRASEGSEFTLESVPILSVLGELLADPQGLVERRLASGIREHPKGADLWQTWLGP
jgi:hypothetical protein